MLKYFQIILLLAVLTLTSLLFFQQKKTSELVESMNFTVNENKIKMNEMEKTLKSVESKAAMLQAQIMRLNVNRE